MLNPFQPIFAFFQCCARNRWLEVRSFEWKELLGNSSVALNEANFEKEELFLSDQSTLSTLTHKLNLDPYSNIENIRSKNPNRLIIAQLNIDSLRHKFDSLVEILHSNVDITLISETKIDSSFPTAQFKREDYTKYWLDRNSN